MGREYVPFRDIDRISLTVWCVVLQEIEREEVARKAQKKEKSKRQQTQIDSAPAIPPESPLADNETPSKKSTASFGNFF